MITLIFILVGSNFSYFFIKLIKKNYLTTTSVSFKKAIRIHLLCHCAENDINMVFISGNGSTVAQKMHKRLNRNLGKTAHWKSDRSREMYGHRIKRLSLQLKTLYLSPIENWLLLLVDINATIIE